MMEAVADRGTVEDLTAHRGRRNRPGRDYLISIGYPADGSSPGHWLGSRAQALVNPREVNPTSRGDVREWMRRQAYRDRSMRAGTSAGGGAS